MKKRMEFINAGRPLKEKKKTPIKKVSDKRAKKLQEAKDENGDTELVRFYKAAQKRMCGHCLNCSARTETKVYSASIFSICHILDKRDTMCPSVKYDLGNWVELCPDCHREFDTPPFEKGKTLWDKREEMGVWNTVRGKLVYLWTVLDKSERRHFPDKVRIWMSENDNFAIEGEYDV